MPRYLRHTGNMQAVTVLDILTTIYSRKFPLYSALLCHHYMHLTHGQEQLISEKNVHNTNGTETRVRKLCVKLRMCISFLYLVWSFSVSLRLIRHDMECRVSAIGVTIVNSSRSDRCGY